MEMDETKAMTEDNRSEVDKSLDSISRLVGKIRDCRMNLEDVLSSILLMDTPTEKEVGAKVSPTPLLARLDGISDLLSTEVSRFMNLIERIVL